MEGGGVLLEDDRAMTPPPSDSDVSDGELARLEADLATARKAQEEENAASMAAKRVEDAAKEEAAKRAERKNQEAHEGPKGRDREGGQAVRHPEAPQVDQERTTGRRGSPRPRRRGHPRP